MEFDYGTRLKGMDLAVMPLLQHSRANVIRREESIEKI